MWPGEKKPIQLQEKLDRRKSFKKDVVGPVVAGEIGAL
jgi:hypothetical protein